MSNEIEYLDFKEAVTLFLSRTMIDIQSEEEVPKLNVIFPKSAFKLFEYIKNNPFTKEGYWVPGLSEDDIIRAFNENQKDSTSPTMYIKNPVRFFELLTEITNAWLKQKNKHDGWKSGRSLFINNIKRLWLRMSPSDFTNVEQFLETQLSFLNSSVFDEFIKKDIKVGEYLDYSLVATKIESMSFCETNERMLFDLVSKNGELHSLPSIHFSCTEQNGEIICYIYAIQNETFKNYNKKIQRKLYKLNAGIENPDVNVGSILSLKTFIEMLKAKGITDIRVPKIQVLSHRYHEMLGEKAKKDLEELSTSIEEKLKNSHIGAEEKNNLLKILELQRNWYNHVYQKADFITTTKTIGLFKIFERIRIQFDDIDIQNSPFLENGTYEPSLINGDNINIKIKKQKLLTLQQK